MLKVRLMFARRTYLGYYNM